LYPIGVSNPRLQAKGKISEVALCDDTALRVTRYDLKAHLVLVVTSGTITNQMIDDYIDEQEEGEPVGDDGRFQIDLS
jgi:hypothetical protein